MQLSREEDADVKVGMDSLEDEGVSRDTAVAAASAVCGSSHGQGMGDGSAGSADAGRRTQRAAAAKARDGGKRIAEMILECNEDGEPGSEGEMESGRGGGGHHSRQGSDCSTKLENDESYAEDAYAADEVGVSYRKKPVKTRWSAVEDTKLKESVEARGSGNWKAVSRLRWFSFLFSL